MFYPVLSRFRIRSRTGSYDKYGGIFKFIILNICKMFLHNATKYYFGVNMIAVVTISGNVTSQILLHLCCPLFL